MAITISRETQCTVHNLFAEQEAKLTFGQRLADKVASFGGSWTFIIQFLTFLAVWAVLNSVILGASAFDAYPYIFLNLILSMVAAVQAPLILMSQKRAAERDRLTAQLDYEINCKAEAEILGLREAFDTKMSEVNARMDEMHALLARIPLSAAA